MTTSRQAALGAQATKSLHTAEVEAVAQAIARSSAHPWWMYLGLASDAVRAARRARAEYGRTREPECDGRCVYASELVTADPGLVAHVDPGLVAHVDPECSLHGDGRGGRHRD